VAREFGSVSVLVASRSRCHGCRFNILVQGARGEVVELGFEARDFAVGARPARPAHYLLGHRHILPQIRTPVLATVAHYSIIYPGSWSNTSLST